MGKKFHQKVGKWGPNYPGPRFATVDHEHRFYPPTVKTIEERDAITGIQRYDGTIVYVEADQTTYQLRGGATNNFWVTLVSATGGSSHTALADIGVNTHAQIDTHIADTAIHFTMAAISITESQISDLQSYALASHNHAGVYLGVNDAAASADALSTTGANVDVAAAAPPVAGQVLTATSPTTAAWQTVAGSGSGDIIQTGTPAAGNIGYFTADKNLSGDNNLAWDSITQRLTVQGPTPEIRIQDNNNPAATMVAELSLWSSTAAVVRIRTDGLGNLRIENTAGSIAFDTGTADVTISGNGDLSVGGGLAVTGYLTTYGGAPADGSTLQWNTTNGRAEFVLGAVTATGTPLINQVATFATAATIQGDANFTWDGADLNAGALFYDGSVNQLNIGAGTLASPGLEIDGSLTATPFINLAQAGTVRGVLRYNNASTRLEISSTADNITLRPGNVDLVTITGSAITYTGAQLQINPTGAGAQIYLNSNLAAQILWRDSGGTVTNQNWVDQVSDDIRSFNLFDDAFSTGSAWMTVARSGNVATSITLNTALTVLGNYSFDTDQAVGAGQDNYVLTYDNVSGLISLEAAAGGGGGTPGGATTQLQYNNAGAFGGMAEWTYNNVSGKFTGTWASTGIAMQIDHNGTGGIAFAAYANGNAIAIDTYNAGASSRGFQGYADGGGDVAYFGQAGAGIGLLIDDDFGGGTGILFQAIANNSLRTNPLVELIQDHATASAPILRLRQDGPNYALEALADNAGARAGYFYSNIASRTVPVVEIINDNATGNGVALNIQQDQAGNGITILKGGSGGSGIDSESTSGLAAAGRFYANTASRIAPVVQIVNDNATGSGVALRVQQDQDGAAIDVAHNSTGAANGVQVISNSTGSAIYAQANLSNAKSFLAYSGISNRTVPVVEIINASTSGSGVALRIEQNQGGDGLFIESFNASARSARFTSNIANRTAPVVDIINDNVTGSGVALRVQQDQGGAALDILGDILLNGYLTNYAGTPGDGDVLTWVAANGRAEFAAGSGGGTPIDLYAAIVKASTWINQHDFGSSTSTFRTLVGGYTAGGQTPRLIACRDDGVNYRTYDGVRWDLNSALPGTPSFIMKGAFDTFYNHYYVVGGTGYAAVSTNGDTWTQITLPGTAPGFVRSVSFDSSGNVVLVGDAAGGDGYIAESAGNFSTWTERSNPKNFGLFDIAFGNGIWVAVGAADGTDAYIVTSTDRITWTERTNPKNVALLNIEFGNGVFVATGSNDGADFYCVTSTDGITWTEQSTLSGGSIGQNSLSFGDGWFLQTSVQPNPVKMFISKDGSQWWQVSDTPFFTGPVTITYWPAWAAWWGATQITGVGENDWAIRSASGKLLSL